MERKKESLRVGFFHTGQLWNQNAHGGRPEPLSHMIFDFDLINPTYQFRIVTCSKNAGRPY